jgi:hypothetical protein
MNLLVTAGNTQARIDRVRCITNIFPGRTGAAIALEASARGHTVTLATSHPENGSTLPLGLTLRSYKTFEDLQDLMALAMGLEIAEQSRRHSAADLMVANTLEGSSLFAFLGPLAGTYERVRRTHLATRLLEEVERLHQEKNHG